MFCKIYTFQIVRIQNTSAGTRHVEPVSFWPKCLAPHGYSWLKSVWWKKKYSDDPYSEDPSPTILGSFLRAEVIPRRESDQEGGRPDEAGELSFHGNRVLFHGNRVPLGVG